MGKKTITIREDSLSNLKKTLNNFAANENIGSKDSVIVSEARPEVDEYEIGQESDNPPIGGNYCHVNESVEKQDIISLAVEHYGLTYNINEAGYILPDGSLLKFGEDGTRDEDHRGIQGVYFQNNIPIWSDEYRYNYVVDFMNHGAIRCDVFTGILDMTQEPTNEQYFVLKKFVSEAEDIDIDFTDNKGNTIHSASYTNANPQLVVADIYRFYNEGIKPQGNVQYEGKKPKHIIKEYSSELRLPFEEPEHASKFYIEQYKDWLEDFGKYGVLPNGTLDFWQEIEKAVKEIKSNKMHGRFDKLSIGNLDIEETINDLKNKRIGPLIKLTNDGKVYVERQVFLNGDAKYYDGYQENNLYQDLKKDYNDNVGGCWSYRENGAKSYCGNGGLEKSVILRGFIRTDDIDFVKTVQLNYSYPSEYEIRVKPFAKIELFNFSYGKQTINLPMHLIVNAIYSGNNARFVGDIGKIDDGFGNVTYINRENKLVTKDDFFSALTKRYENLGSIYNIENDIYVYDVKEIGDEIYLVTLENEMCNVYDTKHYCMLHNVWFDSCDDFDNGFAVVRLNGKYNFINQEGKLISDRWFYGCGDFHEGFAEVWLNGKCDYINKEAKCNFINQEGKPISDQWYENCCDFHEGFAMVMLNSEWNFINQEGRPISDQWYENCCDFHEGFAKVKRNDKWGFINQEGKLITDRWFDDCENFHNGFAEVKVNDKYNFINRGGKPINNKWFEFCTEFNDNGFAEVWYNDIIYYIDTNGKLTLKESKNKKKTILVSENRLSKLKENLDFEVDSSEIDLSSFKKKTSLAPNIWDDNDTLNSKVRLRLLDIADDFWEFVNLSWVKPKGIILTGSICNFNWSHYSDIDLHLIVDFKEIDEKTEFVKDYLDAKKNEWNETHSGLKIYDFQIELYVQDVDDELDASGVYDLEENKWIIKPSQDSVKPIGLNKFAIKDKAAEIMTIIDDMYDTLHSTNDSHEVESIGDDAKYLWSKLKDMRKSSLRKQGESGSGNIVWKYLRRKDYLDKLWRLSNIVYDRVNSISEGKNKNKPLLREYLEKNNNAPLYKYFKWAENASDEEKLQDLMYECPYVLEKYIKAMASQNKEVFEPLRMEIARNNDIIYDEDLIERASKIINELGLYNAYEAFFRGTVDYYDWPSWLVMDFIRVVKNEWCIHFTSDSNSISKEGFTGGTNDMGRLGYTGAGQQKSSEGYDFAFLIDDRNVDYNGYGNEAVIFRTSGVLVSHYGDNQNQVIFWGPNVKSFIPITQEDGDWVVYGQNGQVLIRRDKPSEIAEWATFNLPQYRKQIMTGKNGYIPKQTVYDTNGHRKRVPYPIYRNESIQKYLKLLKESTLNEEWVADGNANHNPYAKRWKAERKALKDFLCNFGKLMQSKENGKTYKCYYDKTLSQLIGYNYVICIQYDIATNKPSSTLYIRALDKFSPTIRQVSNDMRGHDNQMGTYDDLRPQNY